MLVFQCSVCSDFNGCSTYKLWIDHLLEKSHQEKVQPTVTTWDSERNSRAIVASGFFPLPLGEDIASAAFNKFLRNISTHAVVVDFYFSTEYNYCMTLIDNKKDAEDLMERRHALRESPLLVLRLKSTFTPEEWDSLHENVFTRHAALCESMSKLESMDEQFELFLSKQSFNDEVRMVHKKIFSDVISAFGDECSNCHVLPTGNKYAQRGKAILAVLFYSENSYRLSSQQNCAKLKLLSLKLSDCSKNGLNLFADVILTKRNEIKCKHTSSQISCKITCIFRFGIYQFRLLSFLEQYDPRVQPLVTLVCYWSDYYFNMKHKPLISFVLFFLIRRKILPPIISIHHSPKSIFNLNMKEGDEGYNDLIKELRLKSAKKPPLEIDTDSGKPTAAYILKLALEFFMFCGKLDLENFVLSLPLGKFIEKKEFEEYPHLATTMKPYKFKVVQKVMGWVNTPLSIQDPCNVYNNVSTSFSQESLDRLVQLCRLTANALECHLTNFASNSNLNPQFMDICNPIFFYKYDKDHCKNNGTFENDCEILSPSESAIPENLDSDYDGTSSVVLTKDLAYMNDFKAIRKVAKEVDCVVNITKVANALWYSAIKEMLDRVWEEGFQCTVTTEMADNENGPNGESQAKRIKLEPGTAMQQKLRELESKVFVGQHKYVVSSKYNIWRGRYLSLKKQQQHGEDPMLIQKKVTEDLKKMPSTRADTKFDCLVEFGECDEKAPEVKLEIRYTPPKRHQDFNKLDALELLNCVTLFSKNYLRLSVKELSLKIKQL